VSWFRSSRRRRSAASPETTPEAAAQPVGLREDPFEAEAARDEQPAAVAVASPEELDGRPLADLHALAREHGIPRYRLLRKPELLEALGGRPAQSAPTVAPPEPARATPEPRRTRISTVESASVDVLHAMQRLVGELSSSAPKPNARDLEAIVGSPVTTLIVAHDQSDEVVGMLTLALFRIPTGLRAWIEDVVVDERARGAGVGEALTREAIRIANERGARTIDLTSNRSREAANRMYRKLGFGRRDTTVYRIESP
jgi:ribosomal protein S18 acetylase RimI-like enzyme